MATLGEFLRLDNQVEAAIALLQVATNLNPGIAAVWTNLGVALQHAGRIEQAKSAYGRALEINPQSAEIASNLGALAIRDKNWKDARRYFEHALAIKPDSPEAHCNFGIALRALGKPNEAVVHYEQALAIKPHYIEAIFNLGAAFQDLCKPDEAMACYQRVIALKPDFAAAHNNLGIVLQLEQGRLDEARQHFETAIEFEPRNTIYYVNLSDTKQFLTGDPHLAAMEQLAKNLTSLTPQSQIELHFALAKAYADLAEHDRSFRHLLEGNALKRRQITYNEDMILRRFERIRGVFTRELIERKQGLGEPSSVPVFIVGMPRSGTTLVEQILASHPKVFGAGELTDFAGAWRSMLLPPGAPKEFPEPVSAMNARELRQLGATYVNRIRSYAPWAERITDKLPGNFEFAGLINLALPNARIIHVQRNAIDTCLSCFSKLFTEAQEHTYELGELGRYFKAYSKLTDHWRSVLPAGAMIEVQDENVVGDIEQQARRILDFCELEWDPSCLAFYKVKRPVRTLSATQVRQPIYGTSVNRWLPYKQLLQPLIDELGLDQSEGSPLTSS
jgi:tetratricopeptide (TPR) repeat protein